MPNIEMDRLSPDSPREQVNAAISACVAMEVRGGKPQDQAVAMCNAMVKEKMMSGGPK